MINSCEFDQPLDLRLKALNLSLSTYHEHHHHSGVNADAAVGGDCALGGMGSGGGGMSVGIGRNQSNISHTSGSSGSNSNCSSNSSISTSSNPYTGSVMTSNNTISIPSAPLVSAAGHHQSHNRFNTLPGPLMAHTYNHHHHHSQHHQHHQPQPQHHHQPHHHHHHQPQQQQQQQQQSQDHQTQVAHRQHQSLLRSTSMHCQPLNHHQPHPLSRLHPSPNHLQNNNQTNSTSPVPGVQQNQAPMIQSQPLPHSASPPAGNTTNTASPITRQHSLVSRYNCKPCGIGFSQPETLRAHQEGYCTKTNRAQAQQVRSQSAVSPTSMPQQGAASAGSSSRASDDSKQ